MRVTPWNQYQLVDHDTEPKVQLASRRTGRVRGCVSCLCLDCESSSPTKAGPPQNREVMPEPLRFCENNDQAHRSASLDDNNNNNNNNNNSKVVTVSPRSSLKTLVKGAGATSTEFDDGSGKKYEHEASGESGNGTSTCKRDKKKVQWTDAAGRQLFEIREFEMSDGSDSEFGYENGRECSCGIM